MTLLILALAFTLSSIATAQSSIPTPLLFSGNTTVVSPPVANTTYGNGPGQFASLARAHDCSMLAVLAEIAHGSQPLTVQLIQADYQDNLHQLAGLTTTGDQFQGGCPNPMDGNPAYLSHAYAGMTSTGAYIVARADTNQPGVVDIYNATITAMTQQVAIVQTLSTALPNIQAIAAADLNGDGAEDLIISMNASQSAPAQIAVYLGNGDGTFQTTAAFTYNTPGNNSISYFSLADVNGDGKLDVGVVIFPPGGSGNSTLQVLFGQGNGQFTTGPSTVLTYNSSAGGYLPVLFADVNGDGHLDAVLTDGEVLLGDGTGHFSAGTPLNFNINGGASWITAGDFNGDHKLDLAVTFSGSSGNTVSVIGIFLGNGDGTFAAPSFYDGVADAFSISTTDVDGDGNLDLVLGQNGGGAFIPDPPTLFISGGLQVLMGKGDGTFAGAYAYPVIPLRSQAAFAVADLNGDQHPDIITPAALLLGDGTGKFTTHSGNQFPGLGTTPVTAIRIGDLNHDNLPDAVLVTGSPGSGPFVALGMPGGGFAPGNFLSSVPNAIDVSIADVNGDNVPDLIVLTNPSGNGTGIQLQVLLGHGDGTFASPQQVTLPAGTTQSLGGRVYAADVNNDGKMDLVVVDYGAYGSGGQCSAPGGTYILLGAGDGTFGAPTSITAVVNPFDVAIADFNKDGKLDLVISNTNYGDCGPINFSPAVFLGNGDGTFTADGSIAVTEHAQALHLAAADLNHDGNIDVAMANERFSIAFGNGDGTFQPVQTAQLGVSVAQLALADLNADGFPDVVTLSNTGVVAVMINEYGSLTIGGTPDFAVAVNPSNLTASASGTATSTITITPANGFNQAVSFSCSGLPIHATCSFSPATVTPNGSAVTTTLTIATGVATATLHRPAGRSGDVLMASADSTAGRSGMPGAARPTRRTRLGLFLGGIFLLAVFGAGAGRYGGVRAKHVTRYLACGLFFSLAVFWVACGGGHNSSSNGTGGSSSSTPAGTYTVTVNASSGSLNHSTTITLTVQ